MADHPIIFSAPMIRALLDGRKTQTRRIIKLPTHTSGKNSHRIYERKDMGGWEPTTSGGGGCFTIGRDGSRIPYPERVAIWHRTCGECIETPWQVGDRLWVREACGRRPASFLGIEATNGVESAFYLADEEEVLNDKEFNLCPWWRGQSSSPLFMPRYASRLTLLLDGVKVERLQDISEEDAKHEGLVPAPGGWWSGAEGHAGATPCAAYALLWNSLHGAESWDANPWVAALTFRVVKANIDATEALYPAPAAGVPVREVEG